MDGGQDGLSGELIFEQTLRKSQHVKIWGGGRGEEETTGRKSQLQTQLGIFEEQKEGQCGWSGGNEGKWFEMRLEG